MIVSTTVIPAYTKGELFGVPKKDSLSLNTKKDIDVTIPYIGIGERLHIPYLSKLTLPNIFFFYKGCTGLLILALLGIYFLRKKAICLLLPIIILIIMGNIKYFCDRPFSYLPYFLIPLALKGLSHIKYKKLILSVFFIYLLLYASKSYYLAHIYDAPVTKYEKVSKCISEGIVLTDPETRFCITYHLGTTQCYPLNLESIENKRKVKWEILKCMMGENIEFLEKVDIRYVIVPLKPQYNNKQTLAELRGFNLDVHVFKKKINSVDWTKYGYSLKYKDEYVKLYVRGD